MTRPRTLLTALACLLTLAGCGGLHTTTSGATRPASRASTPNTPSTPHSESAAAAQEFAAAYVRFLDGAGTASGLPDTTTAVRALAGQAGAIPAARRRGTLVMSELRPARNGGNGSCLLAARDDAHSFYAQITLAQRHGRWVVVALTPPDFVQVFAPAGPAPTAPPPGSAGAETAARLFLRGYLPWLYGQARLRAITSSSSQLLVDLKTHPPRVPPTVRTLRPKLAAIAMQRRGRGWQALPNISDGRDTYELVLTVTQTRGRWLVTAVSSATR